MIHWNNVKIQIRTTLILKQLNIHLNRGESFGIIGKNGSGKTILAKALASILPIIGDTSNELKVKKIYVSFQSEFELKHGSKGYRQQRWNLPDPEFVPTVDEEFRKIGNQHELQILIAKFNFEQQLSRFVISLSNGEQRKFELIKALAQNPDLLIIDNAFNGLDANSRTLLNDMLNQLVTDGHSIILTGLTPDVFPSAIQQIFQLDKQTGKLIKRNELRFLPEELRIEPVIVPNWNSSTFSELIYLNEVSLQYNDKYVLSKVSWQVNAGECWVLSGANGSGKTSLLNLIFADNPKAYRCDIRLFGKQKGSGESIWDIKNKIGFVSPEMHQYLPARQKVNDVICSGFFDSEGLYIRPTSYQRNMAAQWLKLVGLMQLNEMLFETLSASAQRMVLVIRALVKNPPLVILDEPFQGLDPQNIRIMKNLLNGIANNTNCTMIFVSHFEDEIPDAFNLELKLNNGEMEYIGSKK